MKLSSLVPSVLLGLASEQSNSLVLASPLSTSPVAAQISLSQSINLALSSYAGAGYINSSSVPGLLSSLLLILTNQTGSSSSSAIPTGGLSAKISDALAASFLGLRQTANGGQDDLAKCLEAVVANGNLPIGSSCVGIGGRTSSGIRSLFNLVLEQYLGILTPNVIEDILDALDTALGGFIPGQKALLSNIHASILSVSASTSGNTVTAIEQAENCFASAYSKSLSAVTCIASPTSGPLMSLELALDGVMEQMVGYLPPNVLQQVFNIIRFHLAFTPIGGMQDQLSASLSSVVASLSGNTVTSYEQLLSCVNQVTTGVDVSSSCLTAPGGPLSTAQVLLNSVVEQFFGYLPPNVALDLMSAISSSKLIGNEPAIRKTLQTIFDASSLGPKFVTCYEALSVCVIQAVQTSTRCGNPTTQCQRLQQLS